MTVSVNGTTGITFNDASTQNTAATGFGFKNRIINGAMQINQRAYNGTPTSGTAQYTLDRYAYFSNVGSKQSVEQSTDAPTGFVNSVKFTTTSAYTPTSGNRFAYYQVIEGFNISDLGWGTANAQTVALSFWVKSSVTGTYSGDIHQPSGTHSYVFTFTINSANTWEYKTITIVGPTVGTWATNNTSGLVLSLNMGAGSTYLTSTTGSWQAAFYEGATGSVSLVENAGATFYITGVQLEKGSTATSFDYRPYGTELALCQRYFYAPSNRTGTVWRVNGLTNGSMPVEMRATPTMTVYGTGGWTGANSGKYDQDGVGDTNATISSVSATREFRISPSSGSLGYASYKAEAEL
jgi:hypothetical protein